MDQVQPDDVPQPAKKSMESRFVLLLVFHNRVRRWGPRCIVTLHRGVLQYIILYCVFDLDVQCSWIYCGCPFSLQDRRIRQEKCITVRMYCFAHNVCASVKWLEVFLDCGRVLFGGVGLAINVSQMNVFLSRLEQASATLGYFHDSYGFGATMSPLVATQFINHGIPWHMFYLILAGGMLVNLVSLFGAFTNASVDLAPREEPTDLVELVALSSENVMRLALQNRLTWLLSLFVLLYQGVKVSLGGWIVTYILENKHGRALSAGCVASGYWFGLTLGRILLTGPMHKCLGARRAIIILAGATIALIVLVWAVPHTIAAGVSFQLPEPSSGPHTRS